MLRPCNKRRNPFAAVVALFLCCHAVFAADKPISPDDTVTLALADVSAIPDVHRAAARYLSLHNIPEAERTEFQQVLDFVLNSLSRRKTIAATTPLAGGAVVRVDLDAYGIHPDAWDRLAEKGSGPTRVAKKIDQPEPYYQIQLGGTVKRMKVACTPYYADDGKLYDYRFEDRLDPSSLAPGPWLNAGRYAALASATHSAHPILRADWFIANATMAPAYYEILGFHSLKDFQAFVRYRSDDKDLATQGIVVDSQEVALHQRAALVTPTSLGRYWETFDFLTSVGQDDLLKNIFAKRRDAGEIFAEGPNGLQYFLLVDDKDKIIDFADPNVAADQNTPWKNKLVWGGMMSCTTCHGDGAKALTDEVRILSKPPFGLGVPIKSEEDKRRAQAFVDLFSTPIDDPINQTKAVYAAKVGAVTRGMKPLAATSALRRIFLNYVQRPITLEMAAAEMGVTPQELKTLLPRLKAADPRLVQLDAGRTVRRDQWETSGYPELATILAKSRGYIP